VDNGSSDGTPHLLKRYPVRLVEEAQRRSSYAARNRSIEISRGALIAFIDSDCPAAPGWLRALVAPWAAPVYGAFAGRIVAYQPRTPVERFQVHKRAVDNWIALQDPYLPYVTTANVAYRRRVFERVGLFNPGLRSGGDCDLAWRMQKQTAYQIAFQFQALVYHRHRKTVWEPYRQYESYG